MRISSHKNRTSKFIFSYNLKHIHEDAALLLLFPTAPYFPVSPHGRAIRRDLELQDVQVGTEYTNHKWTLHFSINGYEGHDICSVFLHHDSVVLTIGDSGGGLPPTVPSVKYKIRLLWCRNDRWAIVDDWLLRPFKVGIARIPDMRNVPFLYLHVFDEGYFDAYLGCELLMELYSFTKNACQLSANNRYSWDMGFHYKQLCCA